MTDTHWELGDVSIKSWSRDIPGDPAVKNLPSNAGDTSLIPGGGTKISQATGQLNPCASTTEPAGCNEGSVQTK